MSGAEFEAYVAGVLRHHGYLVTVTKASGDFGVDLVAKRGSAAVAVQCKRCFNKVGAVAVQQVVAGAVMYDCSSTMVVSNRAFSRSAVALAERHNCVLIDRAELLRLAAGVTTEAVDVANRDFGALTELTTVSERLSRIARLAIVRGLEEARELDAVEIRPEHLLVGVLKSAGHDLSRVLGGYGLTPDVIRERLVAAQSGTDESFDDDAEALRSIGIDLRAVRDNVDQTFGEGTFDNALRRSGRRRRRRGHIPFTRPAKKVLELSLREALAHKGDTIGCEHIMLGVLRGGDKFTLALITEHVHASQLRAAILELLDKAA